MYAKYTHFIGLCILLTALLASCDSSPRLTAWDHLRAALELDEASVVEYMALEYLPAVVSYDYTAAFEEAAFMQPGLAAEWLVINYPDEVISVLVRREAQKTADQLITTIPDFFVSRLFQISPDQMVTTAVRYDPHSAATLLLQIDHVGFIRQAINHDPRYAAEYLRLYYDNK